MYRMTLLALYLLLWFPCGVLAQTADGISATPTETYDEVKQLLRGGCLNADEAVSVGYQHPFLKVAFRWDCDSDWPWFVMQINVTLIKSASGFCGSTSCETSFTCVDLCNFWTQDGNRYKKDSGTIAVGLSATEAHRLARALQHFGQLYGAQAHPKDPFD